MSKDRNSRYTKDEVIDKIKKLMALSESDNEHESQAAILHAQRWMARYNLSMGDVEATNKPIKEVVHGYGTMGERRVWWKGRLANIIGENFKCYVYFSTHGRGNISIRFLGTADDVEIAVEVFKNAAELLSHYSRKYVKDRKKELQKASGINFRKDFKNTDELEEWANREGYLSWDQISRIYDKYPTPKVYRMRLVIAIKEVMGLNVDATALRNDFITGFLQGLDEKFKEQVEDNKEEWGLVLVKDKEVEDEFKSMNLRAGRGSRVSRTGDAQAMSAGFKQGKSYGGAPKANIQ